MKAIIHTRYGSPDVLQLVDRPKPTPGPHAVLLKVYAAAANPLDWHGIRADPFIVRFGGGLFAPKDQRVGADVAGVIEAVGSEVTEFRVGDAVFGGCGTGGFAEYVCVKAKNLALKPANVSFEEAASVPVAALTALQSLRDHGKIQAGQKVLINGASGGLGTFGVQLAKYFGAEVTAVCSTPNLALVKSIGADHAIDYKHQDFVKMGIRYDLIVDNVGNRNVKDLRKALTPNGIGVKAGFTNFGYLLDSVLWGKRGTGATIVSMMANVNKSDMELFAKLMGEGKLRPVIDRCYELAETADAIRYLETNRVKGKVVIQIATS